MRTHLVRDWPARFHHPLVLLETFVDPSRFVGTVYRAAGWTELGMTRGFRRVRGGYLSLEDAYRLDDVREALRRGDVKTAARHSRVFSLTPVAV